MSMMIRVSFFVVIGFLALPVTSEKAIADASIEGQIAELILKASKQEGHKQIKSYREACLLGSAEACFLAAKAGSSIGDNGYYLEQIERLRLLLQACQLGSTEFCNPSIVTNVTIPFMSAEEVTLVLDINQLGCKKGDAIRCGLAGNILTEGWGVIADFNAALTWYKEACKNGHTKSCEKAKLLSGKQTEQLEDLKRLAYLRHLYYLGMQKNSLPSKHPASSLIYNASRESNSNKSVSLFLEACNLGAAEGCDSAAKILENDYNLAQALDKDSTELYKLSCLQLDYAKSCTKARYLPMWIHGCTELAEAESCSLAAEDILGTEKTNPSFYENNIERAESYLRDACLLSRGYCERYAEIEKRLSPLGVAQYESEKLARTNSRRIVPYASYTQCAVNQSEILGSSIEEGSGSAAFEVFVKRCGGTYIADELNHICADRLSLPVRKNILCAGLIFDAFAINDVRFGDFTITREDIDKHFFSLSEYNFNSFRESNALNSGHLLHPLNPNASVKLSNVHMNREPLYFPDVTDKEARTSVGDSVYRLVHDNDKLAVISPVNAINSYAGNRFLAVYELVILPRGTDFNTLEPDSIDSTISRTLYASDMSSRAKWNIERGKWNVEVVVWFDISLPQWHEIAKGDIYGKFLSSEESSRTGLIKNSSGAWFVPFDTTPLSQVIVSKTSLASLYKGNISPEVAEAMREALSSHKEPLWATSCGVKPSVYFDDLKNEFSGGVNSYNLNLSIRDLQKRVDWYKCQVRADKVSHQANYKSNISGMLSEPTNPLRWKSILYTQQRLKRLKAMELEHKLINSWQNTHKELLLQVAKEKRLQRREAQNLNYDDNSAADRFYDGISANRHLNCLSNARSFAQQNDCLNNWYSINVNYDGHLDAFEKRKQKNYANHTINTEIETTIGNKEAINRCPSGTKPSSGACCVDESVDIEKTGSSCR